MGNINFDKPSKFKKFLSGRGFYAALALCLVAVGAVAAVTFIDSLPKIPVEDSSSSASPTQSTAKPTTTTALPVNEPMTNIPDNRTTTAAPTSPTTVKPADLFVLPLSNTVTQKYSGDEPVYSKTMKDFRTHNGVDFKGEIGSEVKAAADGTVLAVEQDMLWGGIVKVDHGYGIQSIYYGVTVNGLKKGDTVKVGDVLGKLSEIPCETLEGGHLHLEILANGKYVDPLEVLKREVKFEE